MSIDGESLLSCSRLYPVRGFASAEHWFWADRKYERADGILQTAERAKLMDVVERLPNDRYTTWKMV